MPKCAKFANTEGREKEFLYVLFLFFFRGNWIAVCFYYKNLFPHCVGKSPGLTSDSSKIEIRRT